jgi:hypothetical protein
MPERATSSKSVLSRISAGERAIASGSAHPQVDGESSSFKGRREENHCWLWLASEGCASASELVSRIERWNLLLPDHLASQGLTS